VAGEVRAVIRGEKVILRAREESDGWTVHRWSNDPDVMQFMGMRFPTPGPRPMPTEPPDGSKQLPLLIETLDGVPIGSCMLRTYRGAENRTGSLGIMIGEKDYWSHGYGTDAIRALCAFGFDEMNLHRIQLHVFEYNARGIRCYEKCGFREEGRYRQAYFRRGRYWDVVVMAILAEEYRTQATA
jgi:RimJ/RimL family protein N-acetyltransferase